MQIAVTSQNRQTITEHAGKCRKFWLYQVEQGKVVDKQLIELPIEQTFHGNHHALPAPLTGINVLISGGMGLGMQNRLKQMGIAAAITSETDLEKAVAGWLDGTLPAGAPHDHDHHDHDHGPQVVALVAPPRLHRP